MFASVLIAALSLSAPAASSPYLDAVETALSAYTPERISNYVARVEREGVTEHGFPRFAANLATVVARGRAPEKRDLLRKLMDLCAREMPICLKRGNKSAGNDFSVREIACALVDLEKARVFPKDVTDAWRAAFTAMKAAETYTCQPKVGDPVAHNWTIFGTASEQVRLWAKAGGDAVWRKRAEHAYRNVPGMFTPDGRGTAAYMLPLTVTMVNADGSAMGLTRKVFGPDPLANDQDAALYNGMASGLFGAYGENLFY